MTGALSRDLTEVLQVKVESEADLREERHRVVAEFKATTFGADTETLEQRKNAVTQRKRQNEANERNARNECVFTTIWDDGH